MLAKPQRRQVAGLVLLKSEELAHRVLRLRHRVKVAQSQLLLLWTIAPGRPAMPGRQLDHNLDHASSLQFLDLALGDGSAMIEAQRDLAFARRTR
jgi:hypothetical protein